MSAEHAAAYLDVTVDGLAGLIRDDPMFPVHRLGSGPRAHRRFYRSEIDMWLRSRCSVNRTEPQTSGEHGGAA